MKLIFYPAVVLVMLWGSGNGPAYDLGDTVSENFFLNQAQIDAAIFNGLALDPDGNGTGVLQLIAMPEPSSLVLLGLGTIAFGVRRRRCAI